MKKLLLMMLMAPAFLSAAPADTVGTTFSDGTVITEKDLEEMAKNLERFRSAVMSGNASAVKDLLSQGVSPNIVFGNGDTPLTYAFRSDAWAVADVLIESDATDVNMQNQHGETPIMLAVFKNREEAFEKLLKRGASVKKERGWTALHYAATEAHIGLLKRLIELGADVNAQTKAGVTALDMAARKPNREAVVTLLKAGAYRDYCTDAGLSPADFARKAGDEELAKYLAIPKCAVIGPAHPEIYGLSKTPSLLR